MLKAASSLLRCGKLDKFIIISYVYNEMELQQS